MIYIIVPPPRRLMIVRLLSMRCPIFLTPDEFMDACNVTPSALGKAYANKLPRGEEDCQWCDR